MGTSVHIEPRGKADFLRSCECRLLELSDDRGISLGLVFEIGEFEDVFQLSAID